MLGAASRVFPGAEVVASSHGAFATEALSAAVVAALPEYEFEWGDDWITGLATDPRRLGVYREVVRARAECLRSGVCARGSAALRNMTRYLAKFSEHTQVRHLTTSPPRSAALARTSQTAELARNGSEAPTSDSGTLWTPLRC